VALCVAAPLYAQEPATRAEQLAQAREAKAEDLRPPESSRLERTLLALENGRLFERILNPAEGFHPKIGNLTPGSGMALGPAYRTRALFGEEVDFSAFAAANFDRYWMLEARLTAPALAGGRAFAGVHARRYDFPLEDFFGIGPDSRRADYTTYGLRSTEVGGAAGVRAAPWLAFAGGIDYLAPEVTTLAGAPDFLRGTLSAEVNTREPRGNPRQGARYALTLQRYEDLDGGSHAFNRVEADVQQYISLYRHRRVLALRALASISDTAAGQEVPFYLQRTLGGPDDLRGFRRFRFRDEHMLLLQAEYRWEIFTAVDGALFYDAGKVDTGRGPGLHGSRIGLWHRLPLRHPQRGVPARGRRLRQQRRRAVHLAVRPCLLDHEDTKARRRTCVPCVS
jgi:hypothetical protein